MSFFGPPFLNSSYSGPDTIFSNAPIKTSKSLITSHTFTYRLSGPFLSFLSALCTASLRARFPGDISSSSVLSSSLIAWASVRCLGFSSNSKSRSMYSSLRSLGMGSVGTSPSSSPSSPVHRDFSSSLSASEDQMLRSSSLSSASTLGSERTRARCLAFLMSYLSWMLGLELGSFSSSSLAVQRWSSSSSIWRAHFSRNSLGFFGSLPPKRS
ncbi:fatty acid reductase 1 [Striga asiatica]|uniref:Fatty acid reductase 1 n=1 Tax=Striga asiatica TaxID=4170 RepID=A0A5A7R007_STRAF|nr:fatty acid reductase 1 [Striga asiatica]